MLLAVMITALGGGLIAIAILAAMIQKQNETIRGLREQIDGMSASHPLRYYANHGGNLPVVATSRKAQMVAGGYVLSIGNLCTEDLSLVVYLENTESGRHKSVNIEIEARHTAEFSHFEDWRLSAGDIVEISHEGLNSVTMRFR
jgi:hypothetical protein